MSYLLSFPRENRSDWNWQWLFYAATRESFRPPRKPRGYRRMLQSQDPPQTGNAFSSPRVSSPRPSLLSGEICVHPTEEVSRLQLRIKELLQKKGLSGGFLALQADTWRPLCARYWCLLSGEPPTSRGVEAENWAQGPQPAREVEGTRLPYFQPCSYPQR